MGIGRDEHRWPIAVAVPSCRYDVWARTASETTAEAAYRWWQRRGEPSLAEWTWTVAADRQTVSLG